MTHLKAQLTLVCFIIASPALAQRMDFGGMYAYVGDTGSLSLVGNPYANNQAACPTGYTAYQVRGKPGVIGDNPMYLCGKVIANTTSVTTPVADFGGMYGHGFGNPLVGGQAACPSGFTATEIAAQFNIDYRVVYCHRAYSSTNPAWQVRLGGMYSDVGVSTQTVYYPNPVLSLRQNACPSNFTSVKVTGFSNVYNEGRMYWCYQQY
ncbi:MAG TPA: hypothetical protein VEU33_39550 [Archangium sp.]|nr:hypothetical protein [Archangium sp.]